MLTPEGLARWAELLARDLQGGVVIVRDGDGSAQEAKAPIENAGAVAPHRISNKATKDTATVKFTPTHDGAYYPKNELIPPWTPGVAGVMLAYVVRDGGNSPYTGTVVGRRGLVCDELEPCSEALPCSDWESPSGTQLVEDVTYTETGGTGRSATSSPTRRTASGTPAWRGT
jgi:hypothetical protein